MPRVPRVDVGGEVYHVLNRANAKARIFEKPEHYLQFQKVLEQAVHRFSMRVLSYCIMPNHWHFVLWPKKDGDLSKFVGWLSLTHSHRYQAKQNRYGFGHLYQGRYKSFLIQSDEHLLTVWRYVDRNPLTAGLVKTIDQWKWSGYFQRKNNPSLTKKLLADGPMPLPKGWKDFVEAPLTAEEKSRFKLSLRKSRPFGSQEWTEMMISKFDLQTTFRSQGRPSKLNSAEI